MDIDTHTPQELAAINNADTVLRYLDAVVAKVIILFLFYKLFNSWKLLVLIIHCPYYHIFFLIALCQMEMEDPRKAGKLKEKALKESEKLKKNFKKIQQKADELILKEERVQACPSYTL